MRKKRNILITGGAGFIGSTLTRMLVKKYPEWDIYVLDALTYAGNLNNLITIENLPNYHFIKGNICNEQLVNEIFEKYNIDGVFHLAAESHVDRSILGPMIFQETNVKGTCVLLEAARNAWKDKYEGKMFTHISTDEVYGTLEIGSPKCFNEMTPYDPHSPYSASKASSDFFVKAYHDTFGLPITITHCSNNYGPNQHIEKLIPMVIINTLNNKEIPVYGTGENIRDWIHVNDHCRALELVFLYGKSGETYNIGGDNEHTNIWIINNVVNYLDHVLNRPKDTSLKLIKFVEDRKGHDLRYAIDSSKLKDTIGWTADIPFEYGLIVTISWYLKNEEWIHNIQTNEYKTYYDKQYINRV